MIDKARVRILISVGAVALFAIKVLVPGLAIDAVALGLIALAVLPWLASTIESAKMPGGWEVKFRDVFEVGHVRGGAAPTARGRAPAAQAWQGPAVTARGRR